MKIYTRTGDKGQSSLYNGTRLPKSDTFFHALGDVDELNATLGVAREYCKHNSEVAQQLELLQCRLLDVGSAVATPTSTASEAKLERAKFSSVGTEQLEGWIDQLDAELPPLGNFILPSGGPGASFLHLARTVCRRAERSVVPLIHDEQVESGVGVFLNRLSDYLFTAARFMAMKDGQPETVYKKAD